MTSSNPALVKPATTRAKRRQGRRFRLAEIAALVWLTVVILAAIFAGVLPLAESLDPAKTLHVRSLQGIDLFSENPLGTSRQGLDVLGGLIYGARVSLIVGLGSTAIGGFIGITIGLIAGYVRGRVDAVIGVLTDTMLAFPPLILLLAIVSVVRPSVFMVTLALGVLTIPSFIRISRANTIALAQREYVYAARAMGARTFRIIVKELFPNILWPLMAYSIVVVAGMIVAEASLSYLGLSVPPPYPTWGNMIAAGQDSFRDKPLIVLIPAAVMFLTILSINAVGERLTASQAKQ